MAAPEPDLLGFDDIPDPAPAAAKPARAPALPAEPSPTRQEWHRRLLLGLGLSLAWVAVITWRAGLRSDLGSLAILGELALWTATAAAAVAIALHPGPRGLSLGVRVVGGALWALPAIFVASAVAWSLGAAPVALDWLNTASCLGLCSVLGAVPLALACALFHRAFVTAAPWRLALLGAVCGLSGSIGCQAHCPVGATSHVLVAHGLSVVLGAALGALYGILRGRI